MSSGLTSCKSHAFVISQTMVQSTAGTHCKWEGTHEFVLILKIMNLLEDVFPKKKKNH